MEFRQNCCSVPVSNVVECQDAPITAILTTGTCERIPHLKKEKEHDTLQECTRFKGRPSLPTHKDRLVRHGSASENCFKPGLETMHKERYLEENRMGLNFPRPSFRTLMVNSSACCSKRIQLNKSSTRNSIRSTRSSWVAPVRLPCQSIPSLHLQPALGRIECS
jgi:hypothetical protein